MKYLMLDRNENVDQISSYQVLYTVQRLIDQLHQLYYHITWEYLSIFPDDVWHCISRFLQYAP